VEGAVTAAGAGLLLDCRGIVMRFGGLHALSRVDLSCRPGEILGLIGPNGSGKTTFFNVVTGVLRPQAGTVRLDGREIAGWPPHRICQAGVARTYQLVRPFASLTARENVLAGLTFGHRRRDESSELEEVERLLELVGLGGLGDRPAARLTLVQRKRLEIARALATGPRLLLLDEAVAGLNPTEVAGMLELIAGLRRDGLTLILIEHNMRVIMGLSDRVVVLHHGEKLADGSPEQVSRDEAVLAAYLGVAAAQAPPTP
jgi:branched-chain amino acid transport system ATP-binding protein